MILLYKSTELGNYNYVDPRAGRFEISRTSVKDYMYSTPSREIIQMQDCKLEDWDDFNLENKDDA